MSGEDQHSDQLSRLRAEVSRLENINAVLMDRVEQSNEAVGSSLGLFQIASELSQQLANQQQALREAAQRADQANRAKSDFLANMSHEIRTPLTAILGYADLLARHDTTEAERTVYLNTIKRNGEYLLSIINDILDLSKIEDRKMTIERVATSPVRIIESVASLMRVQALQKGLEFNVRYETPMPEFIMSDPTRLRQILTNLIGNAIKFTQLGSVTLRARFSRNDRGGMRIDVEDTGIGMTEEQLERVFDAFTQADASTTRRFGGSGLGLKITKSLADLLGWELSVQSTPGVGTTFSIFTEVPDAHEVPLVDPEEFCRSVQGAGESDENHPRESGEAETSLAGRTIMLAEDGRDNQRLIEFYLRKAGANVLIVEDGSLAVESAQKQSSPPIDLILMDMQMPRQDGYMATAELRRLGHTLPIIALTANAMQGDREKCLDAGCDDYLTKPINPKLLIECCSRRLAASSSHGR